MPGHTGDQDNLARHLAEWARRASAADSVFASESRTPGEDRGTSDRAERGKDAPSDGLSEVPFLFMLSGLRFWVRSAEVWAKLGVAVARSGIQPDAGQSENARGLLIAELRAALRELTAVSSQEARRLEAELENLAGRDRRDAPSDEPGPYWRRWEVKP